MKSFFNAIIQGEKKISNFRSFATLAITKLKLLRDLCVGSLVTLFLLEGGEERKTFPSQLLNLAQMTSVMILRNHR